jgi:hypothetical protein
MADRNPPKIVRTITRTEQDIADSIKVLDACNGRGELAPPSNPVRLAFAVLDLMQDPATQSRRAEIAKVVDRLASTIRW